MSTASAGSDNTRMPLNALVMAALCHPDAMTKAREEKRVRRSGTRQRWLRVERWLRFGWRNGRGREVCEDESRGVPGYESVSWGCGAKEEMQRHMALFYTEEAGRRQVLRGLDARPEDYSNSSGTKDELRGLRDEWSRLDSGQAYADMAHGPSWGITTGMDQGTWTERIKEGGNGMHAFRKTWWVGSPLVVVELVLKRYSLTNEMELWQLGCFGQRHWTHLCNLLLLLGFLAHLLETYTSISLHLSSCVGTWKVCIASYVIGWFQHQGIQYTAV